MEEADDDVFDPFCELEFCFGRSNVDDLPRRIEQYSELLELAHNFSQVKQQKFTTIEKVFGELPRYYSVKDETGEMVMVLGSELPESIRHQAGSKPGDCRYRSGVLFG